MEAIDLEEKARGRPWVLSVSFWVRKVRQFVGDAVTQVILEDLFSSNALIYLYVYQYVYVGLCKYAPI